MKRITILSLLLFLGCGVLPHLEERAPDKPISDQTPKPELPATTEALEVAQAVEVVLRNSSGTERAKAVSLLQRHICIREIKNARRSRKNPDLLEDRYPKDVTLSVDGGTVYWTAYDRIHFAARHLMDYFDPSDIKGRNSWWPAGTTQEQIDAYLRSVLKQYGSNLRLPRAGSSGPGFKYYDFDLPDSGLKVRVGIESTGRVTSFFPISGQGVINLSEDEVEEVLEAIGKD